MQGTSWNTCTLSGLRCKAACFWHSAWAGKPEHMQSAAAAAAGVSVCYVCVSLCTHGSVECSVLACALALQPHSCKKWGGAGVVASTDAAGETNTLQPFTGCPVLIT